MIDIPCHAIMARFLLIYPISGIRLHLENVVKNIKSYGPK
jgi:hypothetical protein